VEVALLNSLLPSLITMVTSLVALAYWLGRKFEGIENSISELNNVVIKVSNSLVNLNSEINKLKIEIISLNSSLQKLNRHVRSLSIASLEAHRMMIDYLSLKRLLSKEEAEYLGGRVKGILDLYRANPLREEELKFLREIFSSDLDKVTIGDVERAYEIGKKLFVEEGDERGYLIALAAAYIRGYLISRKVKRVR